MSLCFRPHAASHRTLLLGVVLLLSGTLLAGCLGGGDETTPADQDPAAAGGQDNRTATGATGTLEGEVATVSLDPLPDASIFAIGDDGSIQETRSDDRGRFQMELAAGQYVVQVSKVGYDKVARSATVNESETTRLALLLEPLVVKVPYTETFEFTGFFECAFGAPFITDTCTFGWRTAHDAVVEETGQEPPVPRDPGNNKNTFFWTVKPDLSAVMSEMVWGSGAGGTTDEMMMLLSSTPIDNACDCSDFDYIQTTGPSPQRAIVGPGLPDIYGEDVTVIDDSKIVQHIADSQNGTLEIASRGFLPFDTSLAYGHEFTLYLSAFYNGLPPPDYTGIPDA